MSELNEIILPEGAETGETPAPERKLEVCLTFTPDGVKIDVSSNLNPLEQLGAMEIFKAHLLASSLGENKQ